MCLVSDDRMVVVDGANIAVKLVDVTRGHVLHQFNLGDQHWGVCKMSGGRVAVTLPLARRIKVPFSL